LGSNFTIGIVIPKTERNTEYSVPFSASIFTLNLPWKGSSAHRAGAQPGPYCRAPPRTGQADIS